MEFKSRFSQKIDLANSSIEELRAAYLQLGHAMQSGVALEQGRGSNDGTPKHLRVGVNAAMSDQRGLAMLLIAKGIFTEREYTAAMVEAMALEVEEYEARLSADTKSTIVLA